MSATAILAIDQGTTSSRALVFAPDFSVLGVGQQEFTQHYPASGHVEHEPEDIWATHDGDHRRGYDARAR